MDIQSIEFTEEEEKECGRRDAPIEYLRPTNRIHLSEIPIGCSRMKYYSRKTHGLRGHLARLSLYLYSHVLCFFNIIHIPRSQSPSDNLISPPPPATSVRWATVHPRLRCLQSTCAEQGVRNALAVLEFWNEERQARFSPLSNNFA